MLFERIYGTQAHSTGKGDGGAVVEKKTRVVTGDGNKDKETIGEAILQDTCLR